jgi:hypothetical protein
MGTVGTGKTTELLRLAEARAGKELVVFLDLDRHFSDVLGDAPALQHVHSDEPRLRALVERLAAG